MLSLQKSIPLLLVCAAATIMGCGQWVDDESWGESVWSDSGDRVAVTRQYYQRKDTPGGYMTRDFSFEIYTASSNNLGQPAIRGPRTTGAPEGLYYMSDSDYVLVTGRAPSDSGPAFTTYQILADGQIRIIGSIGPEQSRRDCGQYQAVNNTANPVRGIPSPDGSILAFAHLGLSCQGTTARVQFFDAATGQSLSGPSDYELPENTTLSAQLDLERSFVSYMRASWSADGRFMLSFNEVNAQGATDASRGWYLAPGQAPEAFSNLDPSCFEPPTTSSTINDARQDIVAHRNEGLSVRESQSDALFGCAD